MDLDFKQMNIFIDPVACQSVKIRLSSDFLLQFSQKPLKCFCKVDCVAL